MITDDLQLSNIVDRGYLGPAASLAAFGPLLKPRTENSNATIVALFLNAVHEVYAPLDDINSMHSDLDRLRAYIPITRSVEKNSNSSNPDLIRFMSARMLVRDFDELFTRFKSACRLDEITKAMRLKMNSKNTIVQPWPMRITETATQREFDVLLASGHVGSERYVEWKLAD